MAGKKEAPKRSSKRAASKKARVSASSPSVAEVAYSLYEQRGRVAGHHVEDWARAERIVKGRKLTEGKTPV